jgi:glycosyl transferase family 25
MRRIIEYFDRAYIINLEDRPDRRKEVTQEFGHLGISVPNQSIRFYTAKRLAEKGSFPSVGVRGCFTSHRNVLEIARQNRLQNVLVFEDDVSFRNIDASLEGQIVTQLASEPWDIVYFGYLLPSDRDFKGPLIDYSNGVMGAHFYAVNGNFIDPLLQFMKQCEILPPGHPDGGPMTADGALNHIRGIVPNMRVLLAVPNLAYQRSSRTDISPPPIWDRILMLQPLVRRARVIKHKLRMGIDRGRIRLANATVLFKHQ